MTSGPQEPRSAPAPGADRDTAREDLWDRARTYAAATWSLPAFLVIVPALVVPLVAGGQSAWSVAARVAVVALLLGATVALVRRRGHGVVRGLAAGMLAAVAVLVVAIPLGMLVRQVVS